MGKNNWKQKSLAMLLACTMGLGVFGVPNMSYADENLPGSCDAAEILEENILPEAELEPELGIPNILEANDLTDGLEPEVTTPEISALEPLDMLTSTPDQSGGLVKMPWGATFNVNCEYNTVISMGGKEWYVIGADSIGVASEEGTMTLLAKDVLGKTNFNDSNNSEYAESNLRRSVDDLASKLFEEREKYVIKKTILKFSRGNNVNDAVLWPLDKDEASSLNENIRKASDIWWLRSADSGFADAVKTDGSINSAFFLSHVYSIRPAFKLQLSSVLFSTVQQDGVQKLTVLSDRIKEGKAKTKDELKAGEKISIKYAGAIAGKSLSAIIRDAEGKQIEYQTLGVCEHGGAVEVSMLLPETFDDTMMIQMFVEEINGKNETSYVGMPVELEFNPEVSSILWIPGEATVGIDFKLSGTVEFADGTSGTVDSWSVANPSTGATVEGDVLKTTLPGSVTVTATVRDGVGGNTDYNKDFIINVKPYVVVSDTFASGSGMEDEPYELSSKADLILLQRLINTEKQEEQAKYIDKYYIMTDDIDLENEPWIPIMEFSGHLNGNNKAITGLLVDEKYYGKVDLRINCKEYGLFGYLNGAHISNLSVKGKVDVNTGELSEFGNVTSKIDIFAGLLSGETYKSDISNVSVVGEITVKRPYEGKFKLQSIYVGGLTGPSDNDKITASESDVSIKVESMRGQIYQAIYIGGFISDTIRSDISDCKASGSIELEAISGFKSMEFGGFVSLMSGTFKDCVSSVGIYGEDGLTVGGFASILYGTTDNCSSTGNISLGKDCKLGGFAYENKGEIINSSSRGELNSGDKSILSGFACTNEGKIANCFSNVEASGDFDKMTSNGFVYENSGFEVEDEMTGGKIINSYAAKPIGQAGGFVKNNEDGATLKYAYISGDKVSSDTPGVTVIEESKMKLAAGTEGSLVDLLNNNSKAENYKNDKAVAVTESEDAAEEPSDEEDTDEPQGGENSQGDWELWTVIEDENGGFPAFGEPKPIESHEVTFNSNGGTEVSLIKVTEGSLLAELPQPTKTGNIFKGWYKEPAFTSEWNLATDKVTGVTTLYAKWELIPVIPEPGKTDPVTPDPGKPVTPVTPEPGGGSSGGGGGASKPSETVTKAVNSKAENIGKETQKDENGKKVVEISINPEAMIETISKDGKNTAEIRVADTDSQIARVLLTGDIVKKLEDNKATILVARNKVQYDIPAEGLDIASIAKKLNVDSSKLKEIQIEIELSKVSDELTAKYQEISKVRNNQALISPIEFKISAKTAGKDGKLENLDIDKFQGFVDIVIEIPEAAALNKITTGVTLNQDGNYSHIPSEIFKENNRYYARIHSLTNSTYSVIYNPITVDSVKLHWSESSVNDMASRLVLVDTKSFEPNKAISRAEFANYIVRALGLYHSDTKPGQSEFTDVKSDNPSLKGITIASQWGIIIGYPDGSFRPQNTITREEAMSMYSRAMDIAQMEKSDDSRILNYKDRAKVSSWAYKAVQKTLGSGVFNGRTAQNIEPKGTFTCSEAAVAIRNLLIKSELING